MRDWKGGFHLPNANPMSAGGWNVINHCGGEWWTFLTREQIRRDDVQRIIQKVPWAKFILRTALPDRYNHAECRQKFVEDVQDWAWLGNRLIFQPWNEPNHPGEGFGSTEADMANFNDQFCLAYDEIKAVNPDCWVAFTPLTAGNRDVFFPYSEDPEGVPYFMHGKEAAKLGATEVEIQAAILSGPCYEALMKADLYLAHVYCMSPEAGQIHDLAYGLRWLRYAGFFPKPMGVVINELGVAGDGGFVDYQKMLTGEDSFLPPDKIYMVRGSCIWQLCITIHGMDDQMKALDGWIATLPDTRPPPVLPPPAPFEPEPPDPEPDPVPQPDDVQLRPMVGVHGRNDHEFQPADYQAILQAKIELVKVMNFTSVAVAGHFPHCKFVVRLWDGGFGKGHVRPSPETFVDHVYMGLEAWLPYTEYFEIHNEPNIPDSEKHGEGFGPTEQDAYDFQDWFLEVLGLLRQRYPEVKFGFPGLCPVGLANDMEWLIWCQTAISAADWLGVHCYWGTGGHLHPSFGLRYRAYRAEWPNKPMIVTEFGNSDEGKDWEQTGGEYAEWYARVIEDSPYDAEMGCPPILGAACFIASSPDPAFDKFAWVGEAGVVRPVVAVLGDVDWPPLYGQPVTPDPSLPPVACFSAAPLTGPAPLTVQFIDTSEGEVATLFWDFDDGYVEYDVPVATHVFTLPGEYDVKLSVHGPGGADAWVKTITVTEPELPDPDPGVHLVEWNEALEGKVDFTVDGKLVFCLDAAQSMGWWWEGDELAIQVDCGDWEGQDLDLEGGVLYLSGEWPALFLALVGRGESIRPFPVSTEDHVEAVRSMAWWAVDVIHEPAFALSQHARKNGLGAPLTEECDVEARGKKYRLQGYSGGIVYCEVGKWDEAIHIKW